MKRLDIELNCNGLALSLFDGEFYCGEVRVNSGGYFKKVWSAERYPEARLTGQTELERDLKYLTETSKKLFALVENGYDREMVYKGFENNVGLDEFLSLANKTFDKLRELLRGEHEVNVDCCMEREYWLAGDKRCHGQKKRLKLMFDYGAWCLWRYDEYYGFIDNVEICDDGSFCSGISFLRGKISIPEGLLKGQTELMNMVGKLETDYMALYINNETEFSYKGFDNRQQAENFVKLLNDVWSGLNRVLGEKYKLYCCERLGIEDWFTGKN